MAKLADALDLGSSGVTRAGSSPVIRIKKPESLCFRAFFMSGEFENAYGKWKNYGFDIYFDSNRLFSLEII